MRERGESHRVRLRGRRHRFTDRFYLRLIEAGDHSLRAASRLDQVARRLDCLQVVVRHDSQSGNGEWGVGSGVYSPTPHSLLPTPRYFLLSLPSLNARGSLPSTLLPGRWPFCGMTRSTSTWGRGMTCTETSSPTRRAAAAPASVAALTAPTSPRTKTVT